MSDDIQKCIIVWRDWHFIWSNRTKIAVNYYLNGIAIVLYYLYQSKIILSNELLFQIQNSNSEFLIYLDCLSLNVSISCLYDYQKSTNICLFATIIISLPTSGGRSNVKLTHFAIINQDTLRILKMFELKINLKKYFYANSK